MGLGVDEFYDHEPSQFHNRWEGNASQKKEDLDNQRTMYYHLSLAIMQGARSKRPKIDLFKSFPLPWDEETKKGMMKQMTEDVMVHVNADKNGKNN